MKKVILVSAFIAVLAISVFATADAAVWVNGYTRKDGTYVQGHYRSNPDGNPYNNWSYPGNTNPYTGKTATGDPSTYLKNYYGYSGSVSGATLYNTTPSCPLNSYYDGISSCKCFYGYVASGSSCVYGNTYCHSKLGLWSSYDSLTNSCKCDFGYEIGLGGFCTKQNTTYTAPTYSNYPRSCPSHSHTSPYNYSKCLCDTGYKINSSEDGCIAKSKKDSNNACEVAFGSHSVWNGSFDVDGFELCVCSKKYEWNSSQTKCVKTKK